MQDDIHQKIQRYLDQEMTPDERSSFEQAIHADKNLAQEVAFHQDMAALLSDSPENELRKNLQLLNSQVNENDNNIGKWLKYFLLLLPILILAGWWFNRSVNTELPIPEPTTATTPEADQPITPTSETESQEPNIQTEEVIETPQPPTKRASDTSKRKKSEQSKEPQESTAKASRPIAANFEPNPSLDFLIDNNVRDNSVVLEVQTQPTDLSIQSDEDTFNFQFSAQLKSSTNLLDQDFKLHLFSNRKKDFEDFAPLSTSDLTLDLTADNTYSINFQKRLQLKPGLYYYILEDFSEEKIYYVQKFKVNRKM